MKLTAVYEPAKEGGYTRFVEEIPAAISQGEATEEAKASWNALGASMVALGIARELPIVFGSILRGTRSPASRPIAKSRKEQCGPSLSNWKFHSHKSHRIGL